MYSKNGEIYNIVERVQNLFVQEAKQSPLLFADLASMEAYISESYSGRSLIELLQNADDANATEFYISMIDYQSFIVANNGRPFTEEDFISLCRSGASTKKRKSNTIGFRGIGFKAVVNYAKKVHLISGNIRSTFSRDSTQRLLSTTKKVPLIRVPHSFEGRAYNDIINEIQSRGFSTVFVFEIENSALLEEIKMFKSSSLLFVNSLDRVVLKGEHIRDIILFRQTMGDNSKLTYIQERDNNTSQEWLIQKSKQNNRREAIAFKYNGTNVIDANADEAVFHSFMPTKEKLSAGFIVNGDFSTDPSRTRITWDSDSKEALEFATDSICDLIIGILKESSDRFGYFSILKKMQVDPLWRVKGLSINDRFTQETISKLRSKIALLYDGFDVYLQPDGFDSEDFVKITQELRIFGVGENMQKSIPDIIPFMSALGYKPLPLDMCLKALETVKCNEKTKATVLIEAIKETLFGMTPAQKELLCSARIIKTEDGCDSIRELSKQDRLDTVFEGMITDNLTNPAEFSNFMKKLGLTQNQIGQKKQAQAVHNLENAMTEYRSFVPMRTIHRWRSVEKNVAALLEQMPDIDKVNDVSTKNIGYDLEAIVKDGTKRYYEVKSVDSLGDEFTFTNNEYSTAAENKKNYFFAITCQSEDSIEVCFVHNPIDNLSFEKRAVRWEWYCKEYSGEVINAKLS